MDHLDLLLQSGVEAYFCNGHLDQILQVIFSTLESYTGGNLDPSSGYFSGYTEVNLGLCSGHLQLHWLVFVQAAEGFDVCEVPHISWSGKSILEALIP